MSGGGQMGLPQVMGYNGRFVYKATHSVRSAIESVMEIKILFALFWFFV